MFSQTYHRCEKAAGEKQKCYYSYTGTEVLTAPLSLSLFLILLLSIICYIRVLCLLFSSPVLLAAFEGQAGESVGVSEKKKSLGRTSG